MSAPGPRCARSQRSNHPHNVEITRKNLEFMRAFGMASGNRRRVG